MTWQQRYRTVRERLLNDVDVCEANRLLFAEFFSYEERKLKRQNGLPDLDEGCCKTLYGYTQKLRNVNLWFANKPWKDLTREDIQRVYDALEDGTIRTRRGEPFRDRTSYYNKVLKSKPFRLAGKSEITKEVIEFSTAPHRVVRFVAEEQFRRIVSVIAKPRHLLLLWIAWDIGENIHTLLQLTKRDFTRQTNRHSGEPEYLVHLAADKLKRSRRARSEVTVYRETARYADIVLERAHDDEPLFAFGYRQAVKVLHDAAKRGGATSEPLRERVRWKDLRSGMACHLLRCGWTRDEVNARLGHTPRSSALDAYINFLALDRDAPKQRMRDLRPSGGLQLPQDGSFVPVPHQAPQPSGPGPPAASVEALQALRDELLAQVRMVSKLLSQAQTPPEDPANVTD